MPSSAEFEGMVASMAQKVSDQWAVYAEQEVWSDTMEAGMMAARSNFAIAYAILAGNNSGAGKNPADAMAEALIAGERAAG